MSEGVRITQAAREDVPLILTLIRELAEYERLAHEVVATEAGLTEALFGARPVAGALVARVNGEPAGYALYFFNFSTFTGRAGLYLEDLYVRPALRQHGIGRALLGALARVAVERGCGRMEWAVLDWNESAIGFYRSLGAVPLDDWTVFRLAGDSIRGLAENASS